jgi:agmatine deiminase
MRKLLFLTLAAAWLSACSRAPESGPTVAVHPAEFDPQAATWIIWPDVDHKEGYSNAAVVVNMVRELTAAGQTVQLVYGSPESGEGARLALEGVAPSPQLLHFHQIPLVEWWVRDMGPAFVVTTHGELGVVNFRFDVWGYESPDSPDALVDAAFARRVGEGLGLPVLESLMISEGGNREVNGRGTMMLAASVEEGRNPGWTRADMEAEFLRLFNVTNVIWLEEGLHEDDHTFLGPITTASGEPAYTVLTTNGHTDEFARFVDPHTILLAEVPQEDLDDPIARENHRRLERNFEILSNATDQDGNPFRIVRVPLPRTMIYSMEPGDFVYDIISTLEYAHGHEFPAGEPVKVIAAASYLNFVITPSVILAQAYGGASGDAVNLRRDEEVREILTQVFPGRSIVMMDPIPVNLGGGGLHCVTLHQPLPG